MNATLSLELSTNSQASVIDSHNPSSKPTTASGKNAVRRPIAAAVNTLAPPETQNTKKKL
jgi:hypothetical protein